MFRSALEAGQLGQWVQIPSTHIKSCMWRYMLVISVLERLRLEDPPSSLASQPTLSS